jgi:hypothetical protein
VAIQIQGNGAVVAEVDGTTFRALRITARPFEALGFYALGAQTGIYSGLPAASALFSARWGDATRLAVITKCAVIVNTTTAATAAGTVDRSLMIVRSHTVSDSAGTAITLTGNNQKKRTSYGTSLFTDMRIASTGGLTKGTGTEDAQAIGMVSKSTTATEGIGTTIPYTDLLDNDPVTYHPVVLVTNEGVRVLIPTIMPTSIANRTTVNFAWAEVTAY